VAIAVSTVSKMLQCKVRRNLVGRLPRPRPRLALSHLRPCIWPAVLGATLALIVSGCSSSPSAPDAAPSSAPATASDPGAALDAAAPSAEAKRPFRKAPPHILGQITAETGSTWTVRARNGQLYTVTITDATKFGTTKHPAARDQFKVGSQARVIGTISGTTITAAQIRLPRAAS
jgi:hypothetical protein